MRAAGLVLFVFVALALVASAGATTPTATGTAPTTTKADPSTTKNDFKGWIPIALGAGLVVAVAAARTWRRR